MALLLVFCSRKVVKDQFQCLLFYRNISCSSNRNCTYNQLNILNKYKTIITFDNWIDVEKWMRFIRNFLSDSKNTELSKILDYQFA